MAELCCWAALSGFLRFSSVSFGGCIEDEALSENKFLTDRVDNQNSRKVIISSLTKTGIILKN